MTDYWHDIQICRTCNSEFANPLGSLTRCTFCDAHMSRATIRGLKIRELFLKIGFLGGVKRSHGHEHWFRYEKPFAGRSFSNEHITIIGKKLAEDSYTFDWTINNRFFKSAFIDDANSIKVEKIEHLSGIPIYVIAYDDRIRNEKDIEIWFSEQPWPPTDETITEFLLRYG